MVAGGTRSSFGDFAGTQTGRADFEPRCAAVHDGPYSVQIDVPAAFGDVMSVADLISEARPLAANFTDSSHSESPLAKDSFYQNYPAGTKHCRVVGRLVRAQQPRELICSSKRDIRDCITIRFWLRVTGVGIPERRHFCIPGADWFRELMAE